MNYNKTLLQFENISKSFLNKEVLDSISGSITSGDKIGFVGENGSGKTTLLKILTRSIDPDFGTVISDSLIAYVPQLDLDLLHSDEKVFEYLSKHNSDWWNVLLEYERYFGKEINESRELKTLSGGELEKLNIAAALSLNPEILILDEPTNHLDLRSIKELEKLLHESNFAYIVVSHNKEFLNKVSFTIWELSNKKLKVYGGDYDYYLNEKENLRANQMAKLEDTEKKLRKAKMALQKEMTKSQKAGAKIDRMLKSGDKSIPKIVLKGMKTKGEAKHGKSKNASESSIESLEEQAKDLKVSQRGKIYVPFKGERKKGLVVEIKNGKLSKSNKLLIDNLDLKIYHGDRIAILGENGSGKTTLTKNLVYKEHPDLSGEVKYSNEYSTLFVDQKYDLVQKNLNLIENVQQFNPKLSYEESRKVLGNTGFYEQDQILNKASTLSGGETARLTFAMVTSSEADVLVLDEPTNNLDIYTTEIITESVKAFEGTLIVITHDMKFIEDIGVKDIFEINEKALSSKF